MDNFSCSVKQFKIFRQIPALIHQLFHKPQLHPPGFHLAASIPVQKMLHQPVQGIPPVLQGRKQNLPGILENHILHAAHHTFRFHAQFNMGL